MLVKICGITRLADALEAVDAGARALGFVFWPDSPRFIDPYRARAIAERLPPFVTTVGVFVNQPSDYVTGVASLVQLGALQLHGDETIEYAAALRRPVIKALTVKQASGDDRAGGTAEEWPARIMILLDAHDPVRRGGTSQTIDWNAAAPIAGKRRVLLAGGLKPENVAVAIAGVRPFGIDVSSGVEHEPGIKDSKRLHALFEAIHDSSHHPARS
jgi:phosphoribosylanthranilate isomerase